MGFIGALSHIYAIILYSDLSPSATVPYLSPPPHFLILFPNRHHLLISWHIQSISLSTPHFSSIKVSFSSCMVPQSHS